MIDSTNNQLQRCPDAHPLCEACHGEEGEEATCPHQQTFYVRGSQSLERNISEGLLVADLSEAGADLQDRVTGWIRREMHSSAPPVALRRLWNCCLQTCFSAGFGR